MTAYRRGSFDGIGFMLAQGGGLVAWDIDNALDPTTGELEAWALEIVERLNSYTEITPSGRGLRIFALGQLPHQRHGRRKGQLEVYAAKRYVTVTGRRFPGTPATIEDRQDEINEVFERYFSGQANGKEPTDTMPAQGAEECAETAGNTLDDWEIVAKARKAKERQRIRQAVRIMGTYRITETMTAPQTRPLQHAGLFDKRPSADRASLQPVGPGGAGEVARAARLSGTHHCQGAGGREGTLRHLQTPG